MSYILDALRRSQAERERGQVPGLDARPAAVAALPETAAGPPWRWLALAALVLGVAALGLLWWLRSVPPAAPPAAVMPAPEPVARPGPEAAPETSTAPNTATLPIVVSAPVPPPAAPPTRPGVAPVAAAPAVTPAPAAPASAAAVPATTLLSAMSPALRREMPPLVMGGSIWSDSALSRFVIVNGQVVREGEAAAPGVVVERIGPKAVWLRWRDMRLEVPL